MILFQYFYIHRRIIGIDLFQRLYDFIKKKKNKIYFDGAFQSHVLRSYSRRINITIILFLLQDPTNFCPKQFFISSLIFEILVCNILHALLFTFFIIEYISMLAVSIENYFLNVLAHRLWVLRTCSIYTIVSSNARHFVR